MKDYLVIYEHGPTSWGAYAPDLPGCVAVGHSREEVARLIREAIDFHIEGLHLAGCPVPEPASEAEMLPVAA